jgi:hypothetical protein
MHPLPMQTWLDDTVANRVVSFARGIAPLLAWLHALG